MCLQFAELAGLDLDDYRPGAVPAAAFRAAMDAMQELDSWAIGHARHSGAVPAETYRGTERWCQAPGGELPADSWPRESAGTVASDDDAAGMPPQR